MATKKQEIKKAPLRRKANDPVLTKMEVAFCYEYIANKFNGVKAATAAGYSENSARTKAAQLLAKSNIKKKVKDLTTKYLTDLAVRGEDVIKEFGILGFQDMRDFADYKDGEITLKSFEEMGSATRCIKEIEIKPDGTIKFKTHDKKGSLELIGKHLELFTENVKHSGSINMVQDEDSNAAYKKRFKQD